MYFFNSDGSIISCRKNDTDFGWWLKDLNIAEDSCKNNENCVNICIQKVLCVQQQDVFLNICYDCGKYEKDNIYIPPIDRILEFINDTIPKEKLLLGILSPGRWKRLNYTQINKSDCNKYNSKIDENKNNLKTTNNNYIFEVKLKPYTDEPVSILISKLSEIDKLLNSYKHEMNEMRQTLDYLKNCQNEEDKKINALIERTLNFTQDFRDTQYLEDLLTLLQNNYDAIIVKDWPFDSSFIGYSTSNKNYII